MRAPRLPRKDTTLAGAYQPGRDDPETGLCGLRLVGNAVRLVRITQYVIGWP